MVLSIINVVAVVGVLKGFDQLMNLVLDEVQEYMRGMLCIFFHVQARMPANCMCR